MGQNNLPYERDKLVDCLKGYACFLVVFGHVIMGIRKAGIDVPFFSEYIEKFIWTFHVPLFMFLSGYVYRLTGEWKGKGSRIKFIGHKLLNLGIPYFVFSTVYIGINSFVPGVNNQAKLSDILTLWYKTPTSQYWFLYALFVLFVYWTILSIFLSNWQITVALYVVGYILIVFDISLGTLGFGIPYAISFGIGTTVQSLVIDKWDLKKKLILIILQVIIVGLFIWTKMTGKNIIDDVEEILGISASIALISILIKSNIIKKVLLFINTYSFPIYLLHTIFTAGLRIALNKIGIKYYWIHVLGGMLFGIAIPVICGKISNKIIIFDFFFYPSRSIKRLKREKERENRCVK